MAELEEQLNQVLGNPEAMQQIMSLARSLSGEGGQPSHPPEPGAEDGEQEPEEPGPADLLPGLDPELIRKGIDLVSRSGGGDGTALLAALRPYLKEERRERLDRALQLARTTRLIRLAVGAMNRKEERDV